LRKVVLPHPFAPDGMARGCCPSSEREAWPRPESRDSPLANGDIGGNDW
jgi:hypothetical protein